MVEDAWGTGGVETHFATFEWMPTAAASIGQVHVGRLRVPDAQGTHSRVAIKIQYPGVEKSIHSDLSNLRALLVFTSLLPPGLFLQNTLRVAEKELLWETDYVRELAYTVQFKAWLEDPNDHVRLALRRHRMRVCDFVVPACYPALSTKHVLVTTWMEGVPIHQVCLMPQAVRNRVALSVLYLCLKEIFQLQAMQTDPNWANFLYQAGTDQVKRPRASGTLACACARVQIALLDFGATRTFDADFVREYQRLVVAAACDDPAACLEASIACQFLTGSESQVRVHAQGPRGSSGAHCRK